MTSFSKILSALLPKEKPKKNPPSEFERVFRYLDKDGDGKISATELCRSMMSSFGEGIEQADVIELVESSDSDGDGNLGYEEFLRLVEAEEGEEEEEKGRSLREAFAAYEMEGKGFISARSLRRALRRLGEERSVEECEDMIRWFDLDEDGVISFEEFEVMMLCGGES